MAKRLGRFMLTMEMINEHEEALYRYFGNCIVLNVKRDYCKRTIEYLAISKCFRIVKDGDQIPFYLLLAIEKDGQWVVAAEECDNPGNMVYIEDTFWRSVKRFFRRIFRGKNEKTAL